MPPFPSKEDTQIKEEINAVRGTQDAIIEGIIESMKIQRTPLHLPRHTSSLFIQIKKRLFKGSNP